MTSNTPHVLFSASLLTTLLPAVAILIGIVLLIAAFRSPHFRVERSVSIHASAAEIFAHLNDLRKSNVWSPWVKLDPNATYTFEGPPSGVGATGAWDGNNNIGAGRQIITDSRPDELVRLRLEFQRPFKATSTAEFALKPVGGQTVVTWSLAGESNFVCRLFSLFMSHDKMIGGQFEKGLADLKSLVEKSRIESGVAFARS